MFRYTFLYPEDEIIPLVIIKLLEVMRKWEKLNWQKNIFNKYNLWCFQIH
jgi:hypothetical protein